MNQEMLQDNLILETDSYKLGHWRQYPKDTEVVYSYFESREGAEYPYTLFFGLEYVLKKMVGEVVTQQAIDEAALLAEHHFGNAELFNREGWQYILDEYQGHLPLIIRAVPEGTRVPTGNVMMTVENTDPKCYWLTNAVESLLTHIWYPSTVATRSAHTIDMIGKYLAKTAMSMDGLPFMLHDFGYRGATSDEAAAIGGAAHLIMSRGTDTLPGMLLAMNVYHAKLEDLAFSVPATEHSVMTARGEVGEMEVVDQLLEEHPTGILSVVADSYNIYNFVDQVGTRFKDRIMNRDGVFVIRPDSVTPEHPNPEDLVVALSNQVVEHFGFEMNAKGYKVFPAQVRMLWGDGIDPHGIEKILQAVTAAGFSAENYVFGMGGGLLQKLNRDTQRFAFKCSAQYRDGVWHDIQKKPLDASKTSKSGRLALVKEDGQFKTVPEAEADQNLLEIVFENGRRFGRNTFAEIRERAEVVPVETEVAVIAA
jgi:nicotinamide phosphoribosyltransferase